MDDVTGREGESLSDRLQLTAGVVVANKYEIERRLASGGMGVVYLARHRLMDKQVVVKLVHATIVEDPAIRRRFELEAKNAAAIGSHPNIVTITDYGFDGDLPYLVMDYLEGQSLADLMKPREPMPWRRTTHIIRQVLEALWATHQHKVIHRDIKPGNVMITDYPGRPDFATVLDFGIARATEGSGAGTQFPIGTPQYMAPEQWDAAVDERTDLYAVGCMLFEMLSGVSPFDGKSITEVMKKHCSDRRPSARDQVPGSAKVPGALLRLTDGLIALEPADRPQSAQAALEHLEAVPGAPGGSAARPSGSATKAYGEIGSSEENGGTAGGTAPTARQGPDRAAGTAPTAPRDIDLAPGKNEDEGPGSAPTVAQPKGDLPGTAPGAPGDEPKVERAGIAQAELQQPADTPETEVQQPADTADIPPTRVQGDDDEKQTKRPAGIPETEVQNADIPPTEVQTAHTTPTGVQGDDAKKKIGRPPPPTRSPLPYILGLVIAGLLFWVLRPSDPPPDDAVAVPADARIALPFHDSAVTAAAPDARPAHRSSPVARRLSVGVVPASVLSAPRELLGSGPLSASFIFVAAGPDRPAARARALAEEIAGKARRSPHTFGVLAHARSDDRRSALNGGYVGRFTGKDMAPPFTRMVERLPPWGISDPVLVSTGGRRGFSVIQRRPLEATGPAPVVDAYIAQLTWLKALGRSSAALELGRFAVGTQKISGDRLLLEHGKTACLVGNKRTAQFARIGMRLGSPYLSKLSSYCRSKGMTLFQRSNFRIVRPTKSTP